MTTRCFVSVFTRPDKGRPTLILHKTAQAAQFTLAILIQRTAREYGHEIVVPRGFGYKKTLDLAHEATGETRITADILHIECPDKIVSELGGIHARPIKLAPLQNWPMVPKATHPLLYQFVTQEAQRVPMPTAASRFADRRAAAARGEWRIR